MDEILKLEIGHKIDALVGEKAFDRPITWIDYWGLGEKTPYFVDIKAIKTSEHSTSAGMIGANWQKYRDENGEIKEFYGRNVPQYSKSLDNMVNIEREIKKSGKIDDYITNLKLVTDSKDGPEDIFKLITASALDRCKAFLLTI